MIRESRRDRAVTNSPPVSARIVDPASLLAAGNQVAGICPGSAWDDHATISGNSPTLPSMNVELALVFVIPRANKKFLCGTILRALADGSQPGNCKNGPAVLPVQYIGMFSLLLTNATPFRTPEVQ